MNHFVSKLLAGSLLLILIACSVEITPLPSPPSLNLDFTKGVLPSGLTFTRNSAGTYVGADGLLRTASANTPRLEYDPVSLAMRGLLLEEGRVNLAIHSERFENWSQAGVSIRPDADRAPDGTMSAELVKSADGQNEHAVSLRCQTLLPDTNYTVSCFFKPMSAKFLSLALWDASGKAVSGKVGCTFDVVTNRIVSSSENSTFRLRKSVIQPYTNGYYRCSFSIRTTRAVPVHFKIQVRTDYSLSAIYSITDQAEGYIWGAQLEVGAFLTSYIPTTTTAVTRKTDLCLVNNLPIWFNPSQGTWVAETVLGTKLVARIIGYDWPGNFIGISPKSQAISEAWNGYLSMRKTGVSSTGIVRHAMAYTDSSRTLTREGLVPVTSTTTIGKVTQIAIGANPNGNEVLNAHVRRVQYYPFKQSDAMLQLLTKGDTK